MSDAAEPKPDTEQQLEPVVLGAEATPVPEAVEETAAVSSEEPSAEAPALEPPATEAEAMPVEADPEPPAPPAPVDIPTVASTLEVPASPEVAASAADQEGGEWELLVAKLRTWIASGQLQEQWQAARTPLSLLAGLIAVLLVLRVYSALLGVLESIPLLPGLLELAGLVAVVQFSLTRLVRSNDRREVIEGVKQRWQSFRGRS
ncbi:MAG: hypothetical protein RLZZ247_1446 [Cyanobacteriota bacterium]|jgi:hypothetical protein